MASSMDRARMRLQLLGEMDAVSDLVLNRVWTSMATAVPYAELGAQGGQDVLVGAVQWTFQTVGACLREGRSLNGEERAYLRGIGAQRASQRISLDVVEAGFFDAFHRCTLELTRLARQRADPLALDVLADLMNELGPLSRIAWTTIEAGYGLADRRARQAEAADVSDAVRAVLDGSSIRESLARLGWGRGDRCVLIAALARPNRFDPDLHDVVKSIAAGLPRAAPGPIWTTPVPHGVIVASWPGDATHAELDDALTSLAERLAVLLIVSSPTAVEVIGEIHAWLHPHVAEGWAVRSDPGVLALDVFARRAWGVRSSPGFAAWFVRRVLGPVLALRPDLSAPLLETLAVLQDPGVDVKAAAERLHLSQSGVRDRLERINELTGLRYRVPGEARLLLDAHELLVRHAGVLPKQGDPRWRAPA